MKQIDLGSLNFTTTVAISAVCDLARFNMWNTDTMIWFDTKTMTLSFEEIRPDYVWE